MPGTSAVLVVVALALPLQAQDGPPAGWQVRADQPGADLAALRFSTMPPGWHITTGPSVILWHPDSVARGDYILEAEIFFFRPDSRDGEGYGILLGGRDLSAAGQDYAYFLLRNDGKFLVKHRAGSETHTLLDWTAHDAIVRHTTETSGPTVKNVLRVEAGSQAVRFLVNGREVASLPRDQLRADGIVGLRVNHALNLHVSKLSVTGGAGPGDGARRDPAGQGPVVSPSGRVVTGRSDRELHSLMDPS